MSSRNDLEFIFRPRILSTCQYNLNVILLTNSLPSVGYSVYAVLSGYTLTEDCIIYSIQLAVGYPVYVVLAGYPPIRDYIAYPDLALYGAFYIHRISGYVRQSTTWGILCTPYYLVVIYVVIAYT